MKKFIFLISILLICVALSAKTYVCNAPAAINIRNQPSVQGTVIGILQPQQEVDVVVVQGDWAIINYNKGAAYVAARYLIEKMVALQDTAKNDTTTILPAERLNIEKLSPQKYTINDSAVSYSVVKQIAKKDMQMNNPTAYHKFKSGRAFEISGFCCLGVGALVASIGWGVYAKTKSDGLVAGILGCDGLGIGIALTPIGVVMINESVDNHLFGKQTKRYVKGDYTHNMPNSPSQPVVSLRPSYNGLGLALIF